MPCGNIVISHRMLSDPTDISGSWDPVNMPNKFAEDEKILNNVQP